MAPSRKDKRQGNLLAWAGVDSNKVSSKRSKTHNVVSSSNPLQDLSSLSHEERLEEEAKRERRLLFQAEWRDQFKWLVYNENEAKMYCEYCLKYPHHHSAYSREGSINFKISNLKAHCRTDCHRLALQGSIIEGKECIEKSMRKVNEMKDEALLTLFRSAYLIAKRNLSYSIFPDIISLMQDCSVPYTTSLYNDDKACAEMVFCMAKYLMDFTMKKVASSPWFGVMIDESTDISTHGHMVIYLSYLEADCVPKTSFYGIIRVCDGTSKSLFNAVIAELKKCKLDLTKFIAFGSDGCSTMTRKENGVAALLKKNVNPFLTSIHCIAHRNALAVSNVAKSMEYCKKLDKLVNGLASFFNASSKRIEELRNVQEDLACPILRLQRTYNVRWLSRYSAISRVCKSLDAILKVTKKDNLQLYHEVSDFECIYCLHFMADILRGLVTLSQMFQRDHVDVTTVQSLVKNEILRIQENYIDPRQPDCNAFAHGIDGYEIIPDYGPEKGYLFTLREALHGNMFFGEQIKRDIFGDDLNRAIEFQVSFASSIIANLECRFEDNSILSNMKILVPAQHPLHEKALKTYGTIEVENLVSFYGVKRTLGIQDFDSIIDGDDLKKELRSFKNQASTDWVRYSLPDVTSAISSNSMWREAYPNLLAICQIALVQCCSTAICERGFSARTIIKTKVHNRLEIKSLDALMKIAVEGPPKLSESEFLKSIEVWNAKAHRHLFTSQGICSLIVQ